jgi:hypothetical protein
MSDCGRSLLRPIVFIGGGGLGCAILLALRAVLLERLGEIPACSRWLAIDFSGDPPQLPRKCMPEIPDSIWEHARFAANEISLISLGDNPDQLAAQIRDDDRLSWVRGIVPENLLESYGGDEASQIPAFTRIALSIAAAGNDPDGSWLSRLESAISDIAPGGSARADMAMRGDINGAVLDSRAMVVFAGGAQGGTFTGALLPLAIAARDLAAQCKLNAQFHASAVFGSYRPKDGQEERKGAIEHAFALDLAYAMSGSDARFEFAVGPSGTLRWQGNLFDRIYRQECWGALQHNFEGAVALAAESLAFRYFSRPGFERARSRGNSAMLPKVRQLSMEKSWRGIGVIQGEKP